MYFADDTDFSGATFRGAQLGSSELPGAFLEGVSFKNADVRIVDFQRANLEGARFDDAIIYRRTFQESCLTNASFAGADFNVNPWVGEVTGRRTSFRDAKGER